MIEINGVYANAIIYTDEIEASAAGQIRALCDQPFAAGSKIRIMPDVHTGKGCTIGTTMTVGEYVVPNLVGVDIGCGMDVVLLKEKRVNLPALDAFISKNIPHGRDVREKAHRNSGQINISELECFPYIDTRRAAESIGTLGGGNHFIELDRDEEGNLYLVIHTGSRNLGLQVAEYYQKLAYENVGGRSQTEIPFELAYLTGEDRDRYLHDMAIMQRYAALNRQTIRDCILDGLKLHEADFFTTVHNYIDLEHGILRKGSVSARAGERLLIPLNMRDGALICVGRGNDAWNQSAAARRKAASPSPPSRKAWRASIPPPSARTPSTSAPWPTRIRRPSSPPSAIPSALKNRFARSTTLNPATGLRAKRKNNVRRFQNEENHSFGFGGTAA